MDSDNESYHSESDFFSFLFFILANILDILGPFAAIP